MTHVGILERVGIALIHAYRFAFGWLPSSCRYEPTCSRYTAQAIEQFGILRGLVLGAWRLLRCNPFSHGGFDPVEAQRLFRRRTPANQP